MEIANSTKLRGILRDNEPMAPHVTWRAGGSAAHAYWPADLEDLAGFLRQLPATEQVLMVGLGSNLLVRDGGFKGTAVFTHNMLKMLRIELDGTVYVEAGVASPKLAHFAAIRARRGAEFLAGIPGTVGGALAMNAGGHGSETWDHVERVLMLNRKGDHIQRSASDFTIGYRHVEWPGRDSEFFAAAWLRLPAGELQAIRENIRALLQRRIDTQPLQLPNAGSVFRNPPNDHAARLIEAAGLKGATLGGARVSEKHANFIVNPDGRAKASEIERLIGRVQSTVREKFGVELVREVRIVGDEC